MREKKVQKVVEFIPDQEVIGPAKRPICWWWDGVEPTEPW